MPPDSDAASMREARRLIAHVVNLQNNWASDTRLSNLSPRMVNGLLEYNKAVQRGYPLMRVIFTAICGILLWMSAVAPGFPLALPLIVLFTLYYVYKTRASQEYCCAAYALTLTNDVRVLPVIIQATRHQGRQHWRIDAAIFTLLEHVTDAHIGLLTDADQEQLWMLGMEWSPLAIKYGDEMAMRTLRVLARIGNRASLSRMQGLIRRHELSSSEHPVITTARTLIPLMEARLQRPQAPETLLRAADTPTSQPETLLRAAHAVIAESPEQLLRASTGKGYEP